LISFPARTATRRSAEAEKLQIPNAKPQRKLKVPSELEFVFQFFGVWTLGFVICARQQAV
jgi:hypothetical protein